MIAGIWFAFWVFVAMAWAVSIPMRGDHPTTRLPSGKRWKSHSDFMQVHRDYYRKNPR